MYLGKFYYSRMCLAIIESGRILKNKRCGVKHYASTILNSLIKKSVLISTIEKFGNLYISFVNNP